MSELEGLSMAEIAAIILAAGRSSRFSGRSLETKLSAELDGIALIRHVALAAAASRARPILIVTGHARSSVEAALIGLDLCYVPNPSYRQGLSSSLKAGLAALPDSTRGALILLGDMPRIPASVIDRLVSTFEAAEFEPLAVVPVHAGRRGNPVLLGRGLFPRLAELTGDRGARGLIDELKSGVIECLVEEKGIEIDVDTHESLRLLQSQ
jgi:molybdenum cofactor cytidylyltransferase